MVQQYRRGTCRTHKPAGAVHSCTLPTRQAPKTPPTRSASAGLMSLATAAPSPSSVSRQNSDVCRMWQMTCVVFSEGAGACVTLRKRDHGKEWAGKR